MGTNYYMITKNKDIAHNYFDGEYELTDTPDFCYEIHLNKLSAGWKPLFQKHRAFCTFKELENFYNEHMDDLAFKNEYGGTYTFKEYKQRVIEHAEGEPEPVKWVYEEDYFGKKSLHTKDCKPEEADLWTPFDHMEYAQTESDAAKKLNVSKLGWICPPYYSRDPDYSFDWVEGDFV